MSSVLSLKKSHIIESLGTIFFLLLISLSAVYVHSAHVCPSCICIKKYVRLLQPEERQDKDDAALVSSYGMPQVFLEGLSVRRVRYGHIYWNNFLTRETIQNFFGTEDAFEAGPDYENSRSLTAFDCREVRSRVQAVIKMEEKYYMIDNGLLKIYEGDYVYNDNNVHVFDEDNRIFKQLNEEERESFTNKLISTVDHMNTEGKPLLDLDFRVVKASQNGSIYGFKGGARVLYKKIENSHSQSDDEDDENEQNDETLNYEYFRNEVKLRKEFMSPRTDWVVIYPFEDEFDEARALFVEYNDDEKEENKGKDEPRFAYKIRGDLRGYEDEEEDRIVMNDPSHYAAAYTKFRYMFVGCVGAAVGYTRLLTF